MKIGIVAPGIWNSIHLDMARALGALGHDVAIAERLELRRIAIILLELARELVSRET